MTETSIALNKRRVCKTLVGSTVFMFPGLMLCFFNHLITSKLELCLLVLTLGVSTLFFGVVALYALIKLFDSKPGLVVNRDGFRDNSNALSTDFVVWDEVTEISESEVKANCFISVHLKDPALFISKESNPLKRFGMKKNLGITGSPINICADFLDSSHEEVFELMNSYWKL